MNVQNQLSSEKAKAIAFKKGQQISLKQQQTGLWQEKFDIDEQLEYYKNKLMINIENRQVEMVDNNLKKLLRLRARQTALNISEIIGEDKEKNTQLLKEETEKFYRDCLLLGITLDKIIGEDNII